MDNDEILKSAIIESSKEIAKEAYNDTVHPTAKNVGGFFGTLSGFFNHVVMYPLKKLNIEYEQKAIAFERKTKQKYENIPIENRVEPELHIVGPAMESLKYNIMQDDLAELFSNLLVSDMDSRTQKLCSPNLVKIIEQMSPNDARMFKQIYIKCISDSNYAIPIGILQISNSSNYYINDKDNIPEYLTEISTDNFMGLSKSIVNLKRLGLIDVDFLRSFTDENKYEALLDEPFIKSLANNYSSIRGHIYNPKFTQRGVLQLNSLSHDFAKVCLRDYAKDEK